MPNSSSNLTKQIKFPETKHKNKLQNCVKRIFISDSKTRAIINHETVRLLTPLPPKRSQMQDVHQSASSQLEERHQFYTTKGWEKFTAKKRWQSIFLPRILFFILFYKIGGRKGGTVETFPLFLSSWKCSSELFPICSKSLSLKIIKPATVRAMVLDVFTYRLKTHHGTMQCSNAMPKK